MPVSSEIWFLHPFHLPSDHAHAIQILNTCRALAAAGANVRLLVKRNPARPAGDVAAALAPYGLAPHPRWRIEWLPTTHNGVAGLAARWKIRRAADAPVFYARHLRLALTAARRRRGIVIVELHGLETDTAAAVERADGIVTITTRLRDEVRRRFAVRGPIEVIPDAADLAAFAAPRAEGPPRLVYVGQFQPWKGVDVLIRALAQLPTVPALVVGGHETEAAHLAALRRLAADEGVADRIEWTGRVPPRTIPSLLRSGDIGIVPTRAQHGEETSASPLKLFEYMAGGLPVVATDLASIRDIVRDGENGLLFPDGDSRALAAAVRRLLARPAERTALATRARADAAEHTWPARAERILAFIAALAHGETAGQSRSHSSLDGTGLSPIRK